MIKYAKWIAEKGMYIDKSDSPLTLMVLWGYALVKCASFLSCTVYMIFIFGFNKCRNCASTL
jgi:hypothetical protein